ncbi:MAG: hypothetical protein ACRD3O_04630 [Terriglobia bacterium]
MAGKYKLIIAAAVLTLFAVVSVRERRGTGGVHGVTSAVSSASEAGDGPCVSFRHAASHAGETGCVSGMVLRAYTSKSGNTFLDFCSDYRACPFSSVIFASDRNKFGNLETLAGRTVELRGQITTYSGRTEMILRDPGQLHVSQ